MKINYFRRRRKIPIQEEKKIESENSAGSGIWDTLLETGLTKSEPDVKIIQERQILTFDNEGRVKKVSESSIKHKPEKKRPLDYAKLNIGYYILVPIVGGVAVGLVLDSFFKSQPVFIGIFLFLGTVAGFYNLIKLIKE